MEIRYNKDGTVWGYSIARKILLPVIEKDIPIAIKCFHRLKNRRIIEDTLILSIGTIGDGINWDIKLPALLKINIPYYVEHGMSKIDYNALINRVA